MANNFIIMTKKKYGFDQWSGPKGLNSLGNHCPLMGLLSDPVFGGPATQLALCYKLSKISCECISIFIKF